MENLVQDALSKLQTLQARYGGDADSFDVSVKWDSYYGNYIECRCVFNGERFMVTTFNCVSDEDYDFRIQGLAEELRNIKTKNDGKTDVTY